MNDAATPAAATASDPLELGGAARAIERILVEGGAGMPPRLWKRPGDDIAAGRGGAAANEGETVSAADGRGKTAADDDAGDEAHEEDGASEEDELPEEDRAGADDEQPRYTVKVDGEAQEVTLDELVRGYQRNADYTRKTMRLAEERRELGQLREQAERQLAAADVERRQYAGALDQQIPALREQLLQDFGGIDWARLAAEDPVRFAELSPAFETLSGQLQQAEATRHRLRQQQRQQEAEQQQARRRHRDEQWRLLVTRLPELAEPATARREVQAMTSYLTEAGYSRAELDGLVDHRDFILARKAMLYDRMAGSKDTVGERMRSLPKVQRPGAAAARQDRGQERRAALMNRLRRSGSTEDAARAIEELL